jgi:hypothetical protein
MKRNLLALAVAGALALSLGGCDSLRAAAANAIAPGVAATVDTAVPANVQAPIANSVYAAGNFYTFADNVMTTTIKSGVLKISAAEANNLGALETKVYNALVALRAVEQGKDVTAALAVYNSAFGNLFNAASADGINLTPPISASTTGGGN